MLGELKPRGPTAVQVLVGHFSEGSGTLKGVCVQGYLAHKNPPPLLGTQEKEKKRAGTDVRQRAGVCPRTGPPRGGETGPPPGESPTPTEWERHAACREREFFIGNLLVRVHWIVEMIVVEWPCAMGV